MRKWDCETGLVGNHGKGMVERCGHWRFHGMEMLSHVGEMMEALNSVRSVSWSNDGTTNFMSLSA